MSVRRAGCQLYAVAGLRGLLRVAELVAVKRGKKCGRLCDRNSGVRES